MNINLLLAEFLEPWFKIPSVALMSTSHPEKFILTFTERDEKVAIIQTIVLARTRLVSLGGQIDQNTIRSHENRMSV